MGKTIRFIGDIHGKYPRYLEIIKDGGETVQVGDFGFGFGTLGKAEFVDTLFYGMRGRHRMIRGNHDDPDEATRSKHFIPDGTVEDGVMYIGGAASIDWMYRVPGKSWWPNEESSEEELQVLIEKYIAVKPDILVTHECTERFANEAMIPLVGGLANFKSRTRDALERMYAIHRPRVHIFGHWHVNVDYQDGPTRMICLAELAHKEIEV